MNRALLIKLGLCVLMLSMYLFNYLDKVNVLTQIKLQVPKIEKEIFALYEENKRLKYEIEQFENPSHLIKLARNPKFAHLKHPLIKDVLKIEEGVALQHKVRHKIYSSKFAIPVGKK